MTKSPTSTKIKKQSDDTKNATKMLDYLAISDRLVKVS